MSLRYSRVVRVSAQKWRKVRGGIAVEFSQCPVCFALVEGWNARNWHGEWHEEQERRAGDLYAEVARDDPSEQDQLTDEDPSEQDQLTDEDPSEEDQLNRFGPFKPTKDAPIGGAFHQVRNIFRLRPPTNGAS